MALNFVESRDWLTANRKMILASHDLFDTEIIPTYEEELFVQRVFDDYFSAGKAATIQRVLLGQPKMKKGAAKKAAAGRA